jgi:hypothetical protein
MMAMDSRMEEMVCGTSRISGGSTAVYLSKMMLEGRTESDNEKKRKRKMKKKRSMT